MHVQQDGCWLAMVAVDKTSLVAGSGSHLISAELHFLRNHMPCCCS